MKEEILQKALSELVLKKEPQAAPQTRDPSKRREFWKLHASGQLPQEVEDIFFSKNVPNGEKRLHIKSSLRCQLKSLVLSHHTVESTGA